MADEKKSWGGKALLKTFSLAAAFTMGMGVMPVLADVGTWFPVAHDEENLRRIALQNVLEPYTGWIPKHFGLDYGNPGFGTPLMDIFIGDEVARLEEQKRQAQAAEALQNNLRRQPDTSNQDVVPPAGDDPLADDPFLSSSYTPSEDPLSADFLSASLIEEGSTDPASNLLLDSVLSLV